MIRAFAIFFAAALLIPACGPDRNQAPTVDISASATEVDVGQQVSIDGTKSADPDGDPLVFHWTLDAPDQSAVDLTGPNQPSLSTGAFTFAPDVAGTYTVYLTVDDGEFESARGSVAIEASGTGAPVANAGPDQSVEVGAEVALDGTNSSDANGDDLSYQWTFEQKPQGSTAEFSDASVAQPTFAADVAGDFIVGLVVSDGTLASDIDTVIVSVGGEGNRAPVADAGADLTAKAGVEVVLDGSASSDPDSPLLEYSWAVVSEPEGSSVSLCGNEPQMTRLRPSHAGTYEVELEITDGFKTDSDIVSVVVDATVSSSCLMISEYIEGSSYNKAVEIYNCDSAAIDLSGFGFCIVANENTACTNYDLALSGTLAAGEVLTLCHNSLDTAVFPSGCDVSEADVNFNGNDRLIIYEDVDASGTHSQGDVPTDVFGEITNAPSSATTWENVTLRRSNFDRFDGRSGFDYSEFFDNADAVDDFSHFGVAPMEVCL